MSTPSNDNDPKTEKEATETESERSRLDNGMESMHGEDDDEKVLEDGNDHAEHLNDEYDGDGHDEGSLKSYLKMDQIFLPPTNLGLERGRGGSSSSGNRHYSHGSSDIPTPPALPAANSTNSTTIGRQQKPQRQRPPWYHRHPDATDPEISDEDSTHLFMSEPSVSEADSSEHPLRELLGEVQSAHSDADADEDEEQHRLHQYDDDADDHHNGPRHNGAVRRPYLLPPPPPPKTPPLETNLPPYHQHHQQQHYHLQYRNYNNNHHYNNNNNAYSYNHYYNHFNPPPPILPPQPTSPGNTSLSSWDSAHDNAAMSRRVYIHVSPSTYGRGSSSGAGDESDTTGASGAGVHAVRVAALPALPTPQELLQHQSGLTARPNNNGTSNRRGQQHQPMLQQRSQQRRSLTPPPHPSTTAAAVETTTGQVTYLVDEGAKTPDGTSMNSHSNSTSPASEGKLQQLEAFIDDLRVQSAGRVQEHTAATGQKLGNLINSDYGMGHVPSDNISFESSVHDGPGAVSDIKDVLRREPLSSLSSKPPSHIGYTKRPPTPPLGIGSANNSNLTSSHMRQQQRTSNIGTTITLNASESVASSLDLPLSEVGSDEKNDDDHVVAEFQEIDDQRDHEERISQNLVMAFSDSDDDNNSESTPVETILSITSELGGKDRNTRIDISTGETGNPNDVQDRKASPRRPQKTQSAIVRSERVTGEVSKTRYKDTRPKNPEKNNEPQRRHHSRQRSGDAAAAKLATGSKEWRGMTADRIPVPTDSSNSSYLRRKKDTIDRVEDWKASEISPGEKEVRDKEIFQFSSFALGSSVGSDSPIRQPRRTKQPSYRRMRRKNYQGDSDSSVSTDYNQFFQQPAFAPPSQMNQNNSQRGPSSPTLSGYSASPADSFPRKRYPSLSPGAGSFRSLDKADAAVDGESMPPPPPRPPSWELNTMHNDPVFNQHLDRLTPYSSKYAKTYQSERNSYDTSIGTNPVRGVHHTRIISGFQMTSTAASPPFRTSSAQYPAYQMLESTSSLFASDSQLGLHQDFAFFNASQPSLPTHSSRFDNSSPKSGGICTPEGSSPALPSNTEQSTADALHTSRTQDQLELQKPEHEEDTSFAFSDGSSAGDSIEKERNIHRLHESPYDSRVIRHHRLPDLSTTVRVKPIPYGTFRNNQSKKVDRRQFAPQTTTIADGESGSDFTVCPVCNTRQRRFFTVSSAPRQFESAGGYIAFYFAIYVIASLYIFGLQEGWTKLDCIYFAVITLTTAGLGDFVPTTDGAKIICSIFIYFGVACIGLLLGSYIAGMLDDRSQKEALENQAKACANCARIQNMNDASERRHRAATPNPEYGMNATRNAGLAKMQATSSRTQSDVPSEPASKKIRRFEMANCSLSERANNHPAVTFWTPQNTARKTSKTSIAPADTSQLLSPTTESHLLGSPMTSQILARQQHSRHVSIDLGSGSGISLDNFPSGPSLKTAETSTGWPRNFSVGVPSTVQEGTQSKDGDECPPPPPPPENSVGPSVGASSSGFFPDDSSDTNSESSYGADEEELDEHNSGVKNAKYVFLTLREALINSLVIIAFGCLGFYLIEGFSFIDSWYFTTVLLTTVGYGDIVPTTQGGKLFATVYLLVAGTILLHNMSTISMIPLELRKRRTEQAVLTQFGDSLDDDALRELATGPYAQRLNLTSRDARGLDQCTRETFSLVMLIRLGKVTEEDIKLTFAAFSRLDVNNEGVLDSKSIIGGMIQKSRKSKSQLNLSAMDKSSHNGRTYSRASQRYDEPPDSTTSCSKWSTTQSTPTYTSATWVPNFGSWIPIPRTEAGVDTSNPSPLNDSSTGLDVGTGRSTNTENAPLMFSSSSTRSYSQQNRQGENWNQASG